MREQIVLVCWLPSSCHYCVVPPCEDANVRPIARKEVSRPEDFVRYDASLV
jgi:hypothetical protein